MASSLRYCGACNARRYFTECGDCEFCGSRVIRSEWIYDATWIDLPVRPPDPVRPRFTEFVFLGPSRESVYDKVIQMYRNIYKAEST